MGEVQRLWMAENLSRSCIEGVHGSYVSHLLYYFVRNHHRSCQWVYVASSTESAKKTTEELKSLCEGSEINIHCHTLDPILPQASASSLVTSLQSPADVALPCVLIVDRATFCLRLPLQRDVEDQTHRLTVGDQFSLSFLMELMDEMLEYEEVDFVAERGQYSVRGGILDFFSYVHPHPCRVELIGDCIESLRYFEADTQLSVESIDSIVILAAPQTTAHYATLMEYLPDAMLLTDDIVEAEEELDELVAQTPNTYITAGELQHIEDSISLLNFGSKTKLSYQYTHLLQTELYEPTPDIQLVLDHIQYLAQQRYDIAIVCADDDRRQNAEAILLSKLPDVDVTYIIGTSYESFMHHDQKWAWLTEHDIFGRVKSIPTDQTTITRQRSAFIKAFEAIQIGDYVTHVQYGIGRFLGLHKVKIGDIIKDTIKIEYADGTVAISIDAMHKISKYRSKDDTERKPKLHKMSSRSWSTLKERTKKKVKELAFDLLRMYAQRQTARGIAFEADRDSMRTLEASFIYEETPDQAQAMRAVYGDMERSAPMDRLVCGDVGFGKTEIALRAAYKAVCSGYQVIVLVPTTILAFQHYRTFHKRLETLGCRVDYLSRFRTAVDKKEIVSGIKKGEIDILIGTHGVVGKQMIYKDVGLLIVDEEQKFGVNVKEKIKALKANIDTLTLTATPIPRTLKFSLMGVRDLSVIATPPPNRRPIDTRIIHFDLKQMGRAIEDEIKRGGQVFFVNNRIENLPSICTMIQKLVESARVTYAHGQMTNTQLEGNLMGFVNGEYDVLVSTNIIENGLDIPRANTILINDAYKFGLSDLHQMRGRVGRSNKQAYCYLISPSLDNLMPIQRKRLEAMVMFSDLGAGIEISRKDLENRGSGSIFGAEQSGFVNEMGYETYYQLLEEAIDELRAEHPEDLPQLKESKNLLKSAHKGKECKVDTDLSAHFPSEYVRSSTERLHLYKRLNEMDELTEFDTFTREIKDRFGNLPPEATDLIRLIRIKYMCADMGFYRFVYKRDTFIAYFPKEPTHSYYQTETYHRIVEYTRTNQEFAIKQKTDSQGSPFLLFRAVHTIDIRQLAHQLGEIYEAVV